MVTEMAAGHGNPRRILVIFNPAAGWFNRRKIARFVRHLHGFSCLVTLRHTCARGDAEAIARSCSARDIDVVTLEEGIRRMRSR